LGVRPHTFISVHSVIALGLVLLVAIGCSAERQPPSPELRGTFAGLVEPRPIALAECPLSRSEYTRPFWRAPYRHCRDSLADGWQFVEVDADTVVTELSREWMVPAGSERVAWERQARRLTETFGLPVRSRLAPPAPDSSRQQLAWSRTYCAAWRGPDSVQATLRLASTTDVDPGEAPVPWRLAWHVRNGPLADAVACGSGTASPP
jgi:hypothetical protein